MNSPEDLEKALNAPCLPKDELLFELQTTDLQYVNVMGDEIMEYQEFLGVRNYHSIYVSDMSREEGKGKHVLVIERNKIGNLGNRSDLLDLADDAGDELCDLFDRWEDSRITPQDGEIHFYFDALRNETKNPDVYALFVEEYNSLLKMERDGWPE